MNFPVGNPSEKLYLDKPHDASGSHHRRDEEIPKTRTIDSFCTSPLAKQRERSFARSALLSNERTLGCQPVNGRWLANLSAWGKVIEFTAEMLHKKGGVKLGGFTQTNRHFHSKDERPT